MMRTTLLFTLAIAACTPTVMDTDDGDDTASDDTSDDADDSADETDDGTSAFRECEGTGAAFDVFNEFWATFDSEYAVFDVRLTGQTWAEVGEAGCARITDGMSDTALFDVLLDMAKALDDGHTTLVADALGRDEDAEVTVWPHYDAVATIEDVVETEYLDADELTTGAEDEISWGTIDNLGYISITSMDELSASGDEADDVAAAAAAMAEAMADLADVDGIIVDVRANEGGYDEVSLEIARWFAGGRTIAWSEQVRTGDAHDDFGSPVPTYVEQSAPGAFTGPVVLLTSGGTYSAAETFVLAMRVRDDVTVLGERTAGFLSDMIDGELPNGWEFTFSGERYTAADGQLYEVVGVPVDMPVAFDPAQLAAGTDTQLEAAIDELP